MPLSTSSVEKEALGTVATAVGKLTLQEQRKKGDHEYQEYGDNTPSDPVKHRNEVIASTLTTDHVPL